MKRVYQGEVASYPADPWTGEYSFRVGRHEGIDMFENFEGLTVKVTIEDIEEEKLPFVVPELVMAV